MDSSAIKTLYKPLKGNDIRLITIQPSSHLKRGANTSDSPIHCTFEHFPLDEPTSSILKSKLAAHEDCWYSSQRNLGFHVADNTIKRSRNPFGLGKKRSFRLGDILLTRVDGRYSWGDYVALSYSWGNPHETRSIFVNEHRVEVTKNLESALRILREKGPLRAGVKIWIDALCINQKDNDEKGVQVRRMRDIYNRALDVVIWLGEEADESWKAMRLINLLSASCKDDDGEALRDFLDDDEQCIDSIIPSDQKRMVGCWHAFRALMHRSYWNRAWIVQELFMGSRTSPILCGDCTVEYGELSDATTKWIDASSLGIVRRQMFMEKIQLAADGHPIKQTGATPRTALEAIATRYGGVMFDPAVREIKGLTESAALEDCVINSDRVGFFNRLKFSLGDKPDAHPANIVALGRTSDATDPRDKIFAFTGFMDPEFSARLSAGYSSPVEEVFTDFSIEWIKAGRTLDILTHCRLEDNQNPTWVPNWSVTDSLPLLYIGDVNNPYSAGGENGPHLVSADKALLSVAGIIFDTIDGLSATEDESPNSIVQPSFNKNAFGSLASYRDVLWRTFLGNRDFEFKIPAPVNEFRALLDIPLPQRGGHLPAPWDKSFYSFIDKNEDFMINGRRLATYFANEGRREPINTDAISVRMMKNALLDSVMRATALLYRRRLVTTNDGLVGIVPRAAKKGDVIAVLLGCRESLVLRPTMKNGNQCYKVVGSCYVHAIMEGELMEGVRLEQLALSEICLC